MRPRTGPAVAVLILLVGRVAAAVLQCAAFGGPSDTAATRMNLAVAAMPASGGTLDCRGLMATESLDTTVVLDRPITLMLADTAFDCSASGAAFRITSSHVTIDGGDRSTRLHLEPACTLGVVLAGSSPLDHLVVRGLAIDGDGAVADAQRGVATESLTDHVSDVVVEGNEVSATTVGVIVLTDMPRVAIRRNHVHDIAGTASGYGYGIAQAGAIDVEISDNVVERCQRHGIYQAAGGFTTIRGNFLRQHRQGIANDTQTSAMVVARSHAVTVIGNAFDDCADGALSIEPDETSTSVESYGIVVTGNVFIGSPMRDVWVGNQGPATSGPLSDVVIDGNTFRRPADPANAHESIRVFHGKRINITNNLFDADRGFTATYVPIDVSGVTGAGSLLDDVLIQGNTMRVTAVGGAASAYAAEIGAPVATGHARVVIRNNDCNVTSGGVTPRKTPVLFDVPNRNSNVVVKTNPF